MTFLIFHFEISGIYFKDLHSPNMQFKLITSLVFHLDISGKALKEWHPKKKPTDINTFTNIPF